MNTKKFQITKIETWKGKTTVSWHQFDTSNPSDDQIGEIVFDGELNQDEVFDQVKVMPEIGQNVDIIR